MTQRPSSAPGTDLRRRTSAVGPEATGARRRARALALAAASAALLGAGLLGPVLLGASSARADDRAKGPDDFEIYLGEDIEIKELLKAVTAKTQKPIVWSDQDKAVTGKKIQGTLSIRTPKDKLFDTIRALLTFQEIVLIPIGPKGYEVYVAMDARTLASQFILKNKPVYVELDDAKADEIENQDGLFVATNIKVKNIDNLRDARTALQRIVTANNIGNVQEVPAARSFVVTDFAPNVVAIYRLLKQMDVQPQGKTVRQQYFALNYALAEDIEPILQDLFTGKQRISAPQPNQPGGGDVVDPEPASSPTRARTDHRVRDRGRHHGDHRARRAPRHEADVHAPDRPRDPAEEPRRRRDTAQVLQTLIDGTSPLRLVGRASRAWAAAGRPAASAADESARQHEQHRRARRAGELDGHVLARTRRRSPRSSPTRRATR